MSVTGPPAPGGPRGLRLRRAARRVFGDTSVLSRDPQLPVFMGDLVRPYGLPFRPDVLAAGRGHTYGEMAEALIPAVVSPDEPVDLLVLAFGIHDVRPGRATATYLSSVCPGAPTAFAVCDQGTLAPFTALRLLGEYARDGSCRRGLLVVAEQSALHYRPAGPGPVPDRHATVVLLFDLADGGGGRLGGVRQRAGVGVDALPRALAAEVAALAAGRGDVTLVPGAGLAGVPLPEGVRLRPGPAGQPHTGPWWELAGPSAGGLLLLADADPAAGELAVAALDFTRPPADPATRPAAGTAGTAGTATPAGTGTADRPSRPGGTPR